MTSATVPRRISATQLERPRALRVGSTTWWFFWCPSQGFHEKNHQLFVAKYRKNQFLGLEGQGHCIRIPGITHIDIDIKYTTPVVCVCDSYTTKTRPFSRTSIIPLTWPDGPSVDLDDIWGPFKHGHHLSTMKSCKIPLPRQSGILLPDPKFVKSSRQSLRQAQMMIIMQHSHGYWPSQKQLM